MPSITVVISVSNKYITYYYVRYILKQNYNIIHGIIFIVLIICD